MRPSPASRCPSAPLRYLLHNMDTFTPSYAHIGQVGASGCGITLLQERPVPSLLE
jgi:hypothetical protein